MWWIRLLEAGERSAGSTEAGRVELRDAMIRFCGLCNLQRKLESNTVASLDGTYGNIGKGTVLACFPSNILCFFCIRRKIIWFTTVFLFHQNRTFDPVTARKELVKMIALHGLPFILVEYDGFRRFVASLNPLFKPICRTTSRNDCIDAFKEQKVALPGMFKDANFRFSLTADMWTSNQTLGYMCITCHYVTADWEVKK
jgi:hypothetical protein